MRVPIGFALLLFAASLAGCAGKKGPYIPVTSEYQPESTHAAVVMSREIRKTIGVDATQTTRLPDNRMKAQVNIRNLSRKPVTVQVQTVFKDQGGISIGDETAWETIILTENETKTYSATSRSPRAELHTTRIRSLR